jgi:hypothetical protein
VPSQAEIQCECAFVYTNAVFRKNLTDALAVDANDVDTASETGGALGDGRDRARLCRTTATYMWGGSDPLPAEAWGRDRGMAEGIAHAPDASVTAADSRADCDTGGEERRPFHASEVADCQEHQEVRHAKPVAQSASWTDEICDKRRGTTPPGSVVSPRFFFAFALQAAPRRERTRTVSAHLGAVSARQSATATPSTQRRSLRFARVDASAAAKATSACSNAPLHVALRPF